MKVRKEPVNKIKEPDRKTSLQEPQPVNEMKGTKRVDIPKNKEPRTAKKLPLRRGPKPAKMQLDDGVISLKSYLELKAKLRGKHFETNLMSVSNTGQSEIFRNGDDDSSKKMEREPATKLGHSDIGQP